MDALLPTPLLFPPSKRHQRYIVELHRWTARMFASQFGHQQMPTSVGVAVMVCSDDAQSACVIDAHHSCSHLAAKMQDDAQSTQHLRALTSALGLQDRLRLSIVRPRRLPFLSPGPQSLHPTFYTRLTILYTPSHVCCISVYPDTSTSCCIFIEANASARSRGPLFTSSVYDIFESSSSSQYC